MKWFNKIFDVISKEEHELIIKEQKALIKRQQLTIDVNKENLELKDKVINEMRRLSYNSKNTLHSPEKVFKRVYYELIENEDFTLRNNGLILDEGFNIIGRIYSDKGVYVSNEFILNVFNQMHGSDFSIMPVNFYKNALAAGILMKNNRKERQHRHSIKSNMIEVEAVVISGQFLKGK